MAAWEEVDTSNRDTCLTSLEQYMHEAAKHTIPNNHKGLEGNGKEGRPTNIKKTVFWWNEACAKAKKR